MGIASVRFDENLWIKIVDTPLLVFEGKIIRVNKRCQRVTVEIDILGDSKRVDLCYTEFQTLKYHPHQPQAAVNA